VGSVRMESAALGVVARRGYRQTGREKWWEGGGYDLIKWFELGLLYVPSYVFKVFNFQLFDGISKICVFRHTTCIK